MQIVDPEDNKIVFKDRILEFFELSGFQVISQLCKEQMATNEIMAQSSVGSAGAPYPPVVMVEGDSDDANSDKKKAKKNDQVPNFGQTK